MSMRNEYWNTGLSKGVDAQKIAEYKEKVSDGGSFGLRRKLWIALAVLAALVGILATVMK